MYTAFKSCVILVLIVLLSADYSHGSDPDHSLSRSAGNSRLRAQREEPPETNRRADVKDALDTALWPVYEMYTVFVGKVVQLKHLPQLDAKVHFTSFSEIGEAFSDQKWREWLKYFIGFLVCAAFGVVAFLTMAIAGMVIPCCRCCGKCGGKKQETEGKHARRDRLGCGVTLLIFNCILILGVIVIFVVNVRIKDQLSGKNTVFDKITNGTQSIAPFLTSTVDELNSSVLLEYISSRDTIFGNITNLPDHVLEAFDEVTGILDSYSSLQDFSDNIEELKDNLSFVDTNTNTIQDEVNVIRGQLLPIQTNLQAVLESECTGDVCDDVKAEVDRLNETADYSSVNVSIALAVTEEAISNNFVGMINHISANLSAVATQINDSTYTSVNEAYGKSKEVETKVSDLISDIDDQIGKLDVSGVADTMTDVKETVKDINIDLIIYWCIVALASMLCVIIFTNLMGLLIGAACPRAKEGEKCSAMSRAQGARWLLASTAFTFIFYWIYVLVVMVTFVAGGILYTELCQNVIYYENTDSIAALNVIDRMINQTINNGDNAEPFSLAVFDAYRQCERDTPIYKALNLAENGLNITEKVDLSAVKDAIDDIKGQPISIPAVRFIDSTLTGVLLGLNNGVLLDYDAMRIALDKEVTVVDVSQLADQLEKLPLDSAQLNTSIEELRGLVPGISQTKELATSMSKRMDVIDTIVSDMDFGDFAQTLNYSQFYMNDNGKHFAGSFVNKTADTVYVNITGMVDGIIYDVENDIARCRPLYNTITGLVDSTCVQALYPLNALWFSLGWCIFFLIPYLILTLKLSKNYKMIRKYGEDPGKRDVDVDDVTLEVVPGRRAGQNPDFNSIGMDNFSFDPMEAYREELATKSGTGPTGGASRSAVGQKPPPYEPFDSRRDPYILPRPSTIGSQNFDSLPAPDYDKPSAHPLKREVPLPDYGYPGDGELAQLY